jgi:hypothetical protein
MPREALVDGGFVAITTDLTTSRLACLTENRLWISHKDPTAHLSEQLVSEIKYGVLDTYPGGAAKQFPLPIVILPPWQLALQYVTA